MGARRYTRVGIAIGLVLSLAASACGDDDEGAAPTTTSGQGSSTTTSTPEDPDARRGVSDDELALGFTVINLAGAEEGGLKAEGNLRDDIRDVIGALVDHVNEDGGIAGRQVRPVIASVDLLNADDQRQKCLELTESSEVFAVVDSYAFLSTPSKACIAVDHETPLLTNVPGPRDEVEDAFPNIISMYAQYNQRVRAWVDWAVAEGFFDEDAGFTGLGVLSDSCAPSLLDDPEDGLLALLEAAGVDDVSEFRADCATPAQQAAGVPAVLQHKQDGVSHVFFATIGAGVRGYLMAAQDQDFAPTYSVSDLWGLTASGATRGFQPDQFDGTRAPTSNHEGELQLGQPLTDRASECSSILEDAGLPAVQDYSFDSEALFLCEHLLLLKEAADAVGDDLSRAAFTEAVQEIGEFPGAYSDLAIFSEGKLTGGDTVATIEWSRACGCYEQTSGFEPLEG